MPIREEFKVVALTRLGVHVSMFLSDFSNARHAGSKACEREHRRNHFKEEVA